MIKTELSHHINTHFSECNCMERYLESDTVGYQVGKQQFEMDELSVLFSSSHQSYQTEMIQYEKNPVSLETHLKNAFEFLDGGRHFFNGHFGPLCAESSRIRDELKLIVSLSNAQYLVITTDSEPLGHMSSADRSWLDQDYIQKPYLGLEVLSKSYDAILEFIARINEIMTTSSNYIHLVTSTRASHDISQSFDVPVFYVSLMFAVTTPEYILPSEDQEEDAWTRTFEYMKHKWWDEVHSIIEKCVT